MRECCDKDAWRPRSENAENRSILSGGTVFTKLKNCYTAQTCKLTGTEKHIAVK